MPSAFDFCLPTSATLVPDHPVWLHEVKYDGYHLIVARDGNRVRLITRGGHDWTDRFPWIVEAARKNRHQQFVIDGEAVLLGVDGISDFNALHSRRRDEEVQDAASAAVNSAPTRLVPLRLRQRLGGFKRDRAVHLAGLQPAAGDVVPVEIDALALIMEADLEAAALRDGHVVFISS